MLITAPVHHILTDWLSANGYECVHYDKITQEEALTLVKECVGIVTSTRLQINKQLIDAAPQLRWIGRMGSGMEIIDVRYALSKGIACYSSPDGNSNAVAEHALGMLLSVNKRIYKSFSEVKEGKWLRNANRGIELDGKTVGIIGFGNTGSRFAKKLSGFDVKILAYDTRFERDVPAYVTMCDSLTPIYNEADVISFHVPLKEDTKHYFNDAFVEKVKKPFIFINTSRGPVADIQTIYNGLTSGKISSACIDVWEEEPIEKMTIETRGILDHISKMNNVVITPHIAGYSVEAVYKMSKSLLEKIVSTA